MQTDIKYTHKQADSDTASAFAQYFAESCQALGMNTFGRSSVAHGELVLLTTGNSRAKRHLICDGFLHTGTDIVLYWK